MSDQVNENDKLVLLVGKSATGKSTSLRHLRNPTGVMYLNCENNKKLPFKSKFREYRITKPKQVIEGFEFAETKPEIHTIVVDSLTYLMDMFESQHVLTAADSFKGWSDYAQFFITMMQNHVASSSKNVIFIAHVKDQLNESECITETFVPIKGQVKDKGVESYFSCVIAAKKMPLKALEPYGSEYLNITDKEEMLGFKHVLQTDLTKKTINERLRQPLDMWETKETFIDGNLQHVLDRLNDYYDDQNDPEFPTSETETTAA